ncbi:TPA: hypothetical protein HA246_00070 [Candidatus Woesearchaeota archaeon]|nr:hypothetical protein [Candidatus Woesearchaeota archaeon]
MYNKMNNRYNKKIITIIVVLISVITGIFIVYAANGFGDPAVGNAIEVGSVFTVKTDGNVGIGTNNPAVKLDIGPRHTSGDPQGYKANIRLGGGHVITNHANGALVLNAGPDNGEGIAGIYFRKDNTLGDSSLFTELMFIKSDGKVGVGTTNPLSPLHIKSSTAALEIENPGNNIAKIIMRTFTEGSGATNKKWIMRTAAGSGGGFRVYENDETDSNLRFYVQDGGNVGIGTNNPGEGLSLSIPKLHVMGGNMRIDSSANTETRLEIRNTNTVNGKLWAIGSAGSIGSAGDGNLGILEFNQDGGYIGTRLSITKSDGKVTINNLAGIGNAYVCVSSTGVLSRSTSPCV